MRVILLLFLAFPFTSKAQNLLIPLEFNLSGMPGTTLFYLIDKDRVIDSCLSNNGKLLFNYSKKTDAPVGLAIQSKDKKIGYIFWVENSPVKFIGVYGNSAPLAADSSHTQNDFRAYILATQVLSDSLRKAYRSLVVKQSQFDKDTVGLSALIERLKYDIKQQNKLFVYSHSGSIISTMIIFIELSQGRLSNSEAVGLLRKLSFEQQNSEMGQKINKILYSYGNPEVGQIAPDFSLTDKNGKLVRLSDFKGKYIIMLFWASWCSPCVKEMQTVVETYENARKKNIEFVAVSLDEDKQAWLSFIEKFSMKFINLSDQKGWISEPALMYQVNGIPDNFIIDDQGKLIVRNRNFRDIQKFILEHYQ